MGFARIPINVVVESARIPISLAYPAKSAAREAANALHVCLAFDRPLRDIPSFNEMLRIAVWIQKS